MSAADRISADQLSDLRIALLPLKGIQFDSLRLPLAALKDIEPSQVGTIVGALMDALIPQLDGIGDVGLKKHEGLLGEREGYPDYRHPALGLRVELKLILSTIPKSR